MTKIIGYENATIGTVHVTAKRKYHVYEEEGKVQVDGLLREGETAQSLGFMPECDDRYHLGEFESYEEATKAIEED